MIGNKSYKKGMYRHLEDIIGTTRHWRAIKGERESEEKGEFACGGGRERSELETRRWQNHAGKKKTIEEIMRVCLFGENQQKAFGERWIMTRAHRGNTRDGKESKKPDANEREMTYGYNTDQCMTHDRDMNAKNRRIERKRKKKTLVWFNADDGGR